MHLLKDITANNEDYDEECMISELILTILLIKHNIKIKPIYIVESQYHSYLKKYYYRIVFFTEF